jgi:CheY-like chemotaxis protein
MPLSNQVLIVESSRQTISDIIEEFTLINYKPDFRIALNGGHALLHLKHLHLDNKIDSINKILILLNIHTPISNGFEFLQSFLSDTNMNRDKIEIVVFEDNLSEHEREDVEKMGITSFISLPVVKEEHKAILANLKGKTNHEITEPKAAVVSNTPFPNKKNKKNKGHMRGNNRV